MSEFSSSATSSRPPPSGAGPDPVIRPAGTGDSKDAEQNTAGSSKGEKEPAESARSTPARHDPAVAISPSIAHLEAGQLLDGEIVAVDGNDRPVLRTPDGAFALDPDAGLKRGDAVRLIVTAVDREITAELVARNAETEVEPVTFNLTLIAVDHAEAEPAPAPAPPPSVAAYPPTPAQVPDSPEKIAAELVARRPVVAHAVLPPPPSSAKPVFPEASVPALVAKPAPHLGSLLYEVQSAAQAVGTARDAATIPSGPPATLPVGTKITALLIVPATAPASAGSSPAAPAAPATTPAQGSVVEFLVAPREAEPAPGFVRVEATIVAPPADTPASLPVAEATHRSIAFTPVPYGPDQARAVHIQTEQGTYVFFSKAKLATGTRFVLVTEKTAAPQRTGAQSVASTDVPAPQPAAKPAAASGSAAAAADPERPSREIQPSPTPPPAAAHPPGQTAAEPTATLGQTATVGAPAPLPPLPPLAETVRGWQTFSDLAQAIDAVAAAGAPVAKAAFEARIPALNDRLPNTLLFFVKAVTARMPQNWLGARAEASLEAAGKSAELVAMKREFARLGRMAGDAPVAEWRPILVPLQTDSTIQAMVVLYRESLDDKRQDRAPDPDGDKGEKSKRFVVELAFSEFGPVQLDGLLTKSRFDLILRRAEPWPSAMRHRIQEIFDAAIAAQGLTGGLDFSSSHPFPVDGWEIASQAAQTQHADLIVG